MSRDDHAHIQGELPANGADAGKYVAGLFLVNQRDKTVANFKFKRIQGQQGLHFLGRVRRCGSLALGGLAFLLVHRAFFRFPVRR